MIYIIYTRLGIKINRDLYVPTDLNRVYLTFIWLYNYIFEVLSNVASISAITTYMLLAHVTEQSSLLSWYIHIPSPAQCKYIICTCIGLEKVCVCTTCAVISCSIYPCLWDLWTEMCALKCPLEVISVVKWHEHLMIFTNNWNILDRHNILWYAQQFQGMKEGYLRIQCT